MDKQTSTLTKAAASLQHILNNPFPQGNPLAFFDCFTNAGDLAGVGAMASSEDSPAYWLFQQECSEAITGLLSTNIHQAGLRISKLGSPPFLQALAVLGIETSQPMGNPMIPLMGHLFECWVRFVLRSRGFEIIYSNDPSENRTEFCGITGHYDFILVTPLGVKILCEVKYSNSKYFRSILEADRVYNPQTGRMNVTGQWESRLKVDALETDARGYVTQLAAYGDSLGLESMFIVWDQNLNRCFVVPMDSSIQARAVEDSIELIEKLVKVRSVEDALEFPLPQPVAQVKNKETTGMWFLPEEFRYCSDSIKNALFELEYLDGKEFVIDGMYRSNEMISEILSTKIPSSVH
jgi:hypothetical protein